MEVAFGLVEDVQPPRGPAGGFLSWRELAVAVCWSYDLGDVSSELVVELDADLTHSLLDGEASPHRQTASSHPKVEGTLIVTTD
jgi:hypothetical protein